MRQIRFTIDLYLNGTTITETDLSTCAIGMTRLSSYTPSSCIVARAISVAEHLKLEPVLFPTAMASHGYLAGTDELRANDINSAFADKSIDGIWCLRGGYGAHRLLPMLDYAMIRENAKFFGGYSDITAFHIAFRQQCGFGTYHMAMPTSDKLIEGAPYTLEYAKAMLFGEENVKDQILRVLAQ